MRARNSFLEGVYLPVTFLLVTLVGGTPAGAADIKQLKNRLQELESQAKTLSVSIKKDSKTESQIAEHRLVDAEVLYNLKDYSRAAIILMDYVDKFKGSRGYPEAVFYLADCFYQRRDFISAKRYFSLIANEIKGKYYQESLQRLIELSLRTGDFRGVEQYFSALANIPDAQLKPSVPYVKGKYHYFRGEHDAARGIFEKIPVDNPYHLQGLYFLGTIQVQKKNFEGAKQLYQRIVKTNPRSDNDKHIHEMANLALGRLFYEQGKTSEAIDMYQRVSRQSPEFDTAFYEIAWAYIKAKDYQKALRALELLELAHPTSPMIPEVKVLAGNLLIRLKEWGQATTVFTDTREQFVPIHKRMNQLLKEHTDPNLFFDVLLSRNQNRLAMNLQMPPVAVKWVKEMQEVKQALNLIGDLREMQDNILEVEQLIKRLDHAVNTPSKVKIFPEYAQAKARALEIENKLILIQKEILEGERSLVAQYLDNVDQAVLAGIAEKRASLEKQIQELPTRADTYDSRESAALEKIAFLSKELNRHGISINSLKAQLVAAEKYFNDTDGARKPEIRDTFKKEAEEVKILIESLESESEKIALLLEDARNMTGVGGQQEMQERGAKEQFQDILSQEHQRYVGIRGKITGRSVEAFDTLAWLLKQCDQVVGLLKVFDQRLNGAVDEKLKTVRNALTEEKQSLSGYMANVDDFQKKSDDVAGSITYAGFRDVAKRFYEIIVRADVGIIDVAWALKDVKSSDVSSLVRQQKMDIKVLDDEFKEVLRGE